MRAAYMPAERQYDPNIQDAHRMVRSRAALDVDESGEHLAFGTTTGSLWVSENQGDRWEAVSEHLPPVCCVRFA